MSGMSGMSGMASELLSTDALLLNRQAVVGPFTGVALHISPAAFNQPDTLALCADQPRVTACFSELLEGLVFRCNETDRQATLGYADLQARSPKHLTLVELRAPTTTQLRQQLDLVAAYADLRSDRAAEVVAQTGFPLAFWSSVAGLQAHRHRKTLQLMDLAFSLAVHVCMRFKQIFSSPRPVAFSPQIQPMIPTPGHGSWPSGHATESFVVATLLEALLNAATAQNTPHNGTASREQLQRLAARIAVNRTVAGLHFPVDSAAGRLLGSVLAEFLVARATQASVHARGFDGRKFEGPAGQALDFSLHQSLDDGPGYSRDKRGKTVGHAPLVAWLWKEAVKEWA